MADAGDIKVKVSIEYDGSGIEQAKKDLASLASSAGEVGGNAGGAGDEIANLGEKASTSAGSAKEFSAALESLPKVMESGASAASGMTEVLSEGGQAFRETGTAIEELQKPLGETTALLQNASPPMQAISKNAQSMQEQMTTVSESVAQVGESLSQSVPMLPQLAESLQTVSATTDHFAQNMTAFQSAWSDPAPFEMIQQHLQSTGQTWGDFSSSIGEYNTAMLEQMKTSTEGSHAVLTGESSSVQAVGKAFEDSAHSAQAFTDQFTVMGTSAASTGESLGSVNKAINEFGGVGKAMYGPEAAMKSVSFGSAFGEAFSGVTGFLNEIAMPLMAMQMIGMAVGAAGQAIYDAAAVAEGPAAHSFGTFTGTVDALGQSAQKAGAAFSEGFGQQVIPTLNALNYQVSNGDVGGLGGFVGGIASTVANLTMITTGINPQGGLQGLANQGAALLGMQQPYQGPPPEQQAQITYQQQIASMPQTVMQQTYQNRTQTAMNLADAISPAFLQSQDDLQASQQIYQRLQQSYNISHPVNQAQMIQQAQYDQYAQQQTQNYQQQMAGGASGPVDIPGYWGGVAGGIGQSITSNRGFSGLFGGNAPGIADLFGLPKPDWGGIGGGIGNWFQGLFSGGQQDAPPVGIPGSGGCFVAGTRVLMGNGQERAIETLHVGEEVQSHDGTGRITDCIIFPAKQTYKLVFSDGTILFTTDSHPLASMNGWKSIDPKSTYRENPGLLVTPLSIGDLIYTVDGSTCRLLSLQKHEIVQVYNITVDTSHTYYANNILVHNAKLGGGGVGVGTEQVSLSHTFTANVTWEAQNLQKQFTAAASWAAQNLAKSFIGQAFWSGVNLAKNFIGTAAWVGQGLTKTFQGVASWIAEGGLQHTFEGVANWIAQGGLQHTFEGVASWIAEGGLQHTFEGVASWIAEGGLEHTFQGVANWIGQGLTNLFTGKASWNGQDLQHTFNAVANWNAQNLNPTFTVHPSVTMLAEGTTNWPGGPAIVGEGGSPEVVEHNGQYTMFDQGAALVDLPSGANVYPMRDLMSYSSPSQFADGTGGGGMIPISLGGGSNASQPMVINLNIDGQTFWSSAGMSLAQSARAGSGMRSY